METMNVKYQLRGIELLENYLVHPQIPLNQERTYNFDINIEQKINNDEKIVIVLTSVKIIHQEDQECHASIKTSCIYIVDNLNELLLPDLNKVNLPEQFVITLNSISLSTTRGIMFSCFKGTFMHNVYLPIVNPSEFTINKVVE